MNDVPHQKWLFRVAASADSGGGHVGRSLVLAREMAPQVTFSVPQDSPYQAQIAASGFPTVSPEGEADSYHGIWLDTYRDDFDRYRQKTPHLAIIEDHKDLYSRADLYIRPFPGQYTKPAHGRVYEGLTHALVDPLFFTSPSSEVKEKVETVTVFMGRYDSANAATRLLRILARRTEAFHTQLVMGSSAPHLKSVRDYLENSFDRSVELHVDLPDLSAIFAKSDLLILSGGVSALEACAMAKPALVLSVAANQVPMSSALGQSGAVEYVGFIKDTSDAEIERALDTAMNHTNRQRMIDLAAKVLNGSGATRVARILESLGKGASHASYQHS